MNSDPSVSAIIPARDEEFNIGRVVRSLAAQLEISEIIVVDDQSADGTAHVLEGLADDVPQLRALEAGSLPEGWVGKNHAAWQGAQRAGGAWLLFTDADALHLKGSTARALHQAEASGADLLSISPAQELHTWWERAMIPFVYSRLSQLYSYAAVNDPSSPAAAANGQFILIRRQAYEAIGGHAAVRGEVLEDVALARRAKAAGFRLLFTPDEGMVRVRMYTTFRAMWEGWTKNLCPLVAGAGQRVTRELFYVLPWIPLLCLALTSRFPIAGLVGLVLLAGRHASYTATLRRNRFPLSSVVYYMAAVPLYCAALAASDWHYARGRVTWRGRQYPVGRLGNQDPQGEA
jgi:cellulose synthase/poly-beta-1,6-N-acetylglucosamine synthase-like glycosyltransferase